MADIRWKAHPHDLHRLTDRVSSVYVERSHLDRAENAIAVINRRETVRIPAALVAVVLLGPGTRVTHGAMQLLADSGTAVCSVGEQGVRMYASGLGPSRGAALLQRQAYLVSRTKLRLEVARAMYAMRFPGEDVTTLTMQQLRGREGARVRKIYQQQARRYGVSWIGRASKAGDAFAAGDDLNRLLSAVNAALYGLCHAVIVGLGASPGRICIGSGIRPVTSHRWWKALTSYAGRMTKNSNFDPWSAVDAAANGTHRLLVVGDWSNYLVVNRVGTTVSYLPPGVLQGSNRRPDGRVGWYVYWRVGANVLTPKAFRLLKVTTTA
ncbi:type I-E CRISPR-associated endonuclease Cas1e [Saccharomonospora azurea]|uniref:type I-E CRISPR-associated endonuclease Cas1e n=1 Tax=Saccharomonospora azurea TaxID=40988 RepID=UPI003D8F9037